ncbi:MAG: response regulator transcription factor [Sphingobacteriales bacterium]|nr:MAG: response regulator transcription factor [Sphingobacteriales bacterium]
MKVLVVEDEDDLREVIIRSLQKENFVVEAAADYDTAMEKLYTYEYDCILLDIMLPGGSGLKILEQLRQEKEEYHVIIISAKDSVDDKVKGLDLGADDYLVKPFHLAELSARVKSLVRRKKMNGDNIIQFNNLSIDTVSRCLHVSGQEVSLNRKEYDVLLYFVLNKNRVINKTSLAEHVWGDHTDQSDNYEFIYSQVKNLRKKLKDAGAEAEIQAIYGIGYKLTGVETA